MFKKILFTLFACLTFGGYLHAQDVRVITLNEAIEIALNNNYQLKQAENNLYLAEQNIINEYADFLPAVSANLNGGRQVGQQFIQEQVNFVDVTSKFVSGNINANIIVFDGFNNINSLRLSQHQKVSREENLQRVRENVIFSTASSYLRVILDRELLEIAKGNLTTSQNQLEQVRAQVEVGSRASVDLYEQEALVASNELNVTQRENSLKFSELLLIRQLQIDPVGNYEFVTPEVDEERSIAEIKSYKLSELVDEALLNRSDLKSAIANLRGLDYQLKLAKGNLYPTISASMGLSTRYSASDLFNSPSFNDQFFDQQVNRSIGFSVSFPLFQRWNRMYNIQQAKVQLKNAELALDDTRMQIIQEVAQAYNDYVSYVQQLEAAEKARIASQKAFETQQERYNVGSSTFVELSQAQTNYVRAQSDYTSALYNIIFQEKLLDYFIGKLTLEL